MTVAFIRIITYCAYSLRRWIFRIEDRRWQRSQRERISLDGIAVERQEEVLLRRFHRHRSIRAHGCPLF